MPAASPQAGGPLGGPISVSQVRPSGQPQNLVGGYPNIRPSIGDMFGLRDLRWNPSVVTSLLKMAPVAPGIKNMPKQAKIGPKRPNIVPKALVDPAQRVDSTFNDKLRANGTCWTMETH